MAFEAGPTQTSLATSTFAIHGGISADDAVALSPEAAVNKLSALVSRSADLHASMPKFDDINELVQAKQRHQSRIADLRRPKSEGGFGLPELAQQVVAEQRALERVDKQLARQQALRDSRAAFQPTLRLKAAVLDWLTKGGIPGGCTLDVVADQDITSLLRKGERIHDAVARLRHRLSELALDAQRVRSAPWPSRDVKAKLRAQIAQLAEAGAPNIAAALKHGHQISFATTSLSSMVRGDKPALAFVETTDTLALLCFLFRDEIIARIKSEIDAVAEDKATLDDAERERQLAAIADQALAIERQEVALIWHAEARGEIIDFRPTTSALALLSLRLVTAPRPVPGSSPGVSFDVVGR